jgi:Fe-S cluster biosynthesis and repair protein YggX
MNPRSYVHLIFDKVTKNTMEKRQPLQQMLLGEVVISLQKTETRFIPISLYLYQFKVD